MTTSVSVFATEAIKYHVDSNGLQPSDLIPLIRRGNCVRGALNRMLFNLISRFLVSDVPLIYRHCRDLHPRRQ